MICFAVFLAFVCYFYDILRKGAPLEAPDKRGTAIMQGAKRKSTHGWMLLLGVGDGIARLFVTWNEAVLISLVYDSTAIMVVR